MLKNKAFEGALETIKGIVGKEHFYDSYEERLCYSYDATLEEAIPDAIVFPGSAEEIALIMKTANEYKMPVIPRGAGTGLSGGSVPVKNGLVLNLCRLNRILEINQKDYYAVVESGVSVRLRAIGPCPSSTGLDAQPKREIANRSSADRIGNPGVAGKAASHLLPSLRLSLIHI